VQEFNQYVSALGGAVNDARAQQASADAAHAAAEQSSEATAAADRALTAAQSAVASAQGNVQEALKAAPDLAALDKDVRQGQTDLAKVKSAATTARSHSGTYDACSDASDAQSAASDVQGDSSSLDGDVVGVTTSADELDRLADVLRDAVTALQATAASQGAPTGLDERTATQLVTTAKSTTKGWRAKAATQQKAMAGLVADAGKIADQAGQIPCS